MPRLLTLGQGMLFLASIAANAQESAPFPDPPPDVPPSVVLATEEEPGDRLVISGTVYRANGTTPYAGLVIYLYQTDATGVYNTESGSWRAPRLHGWVKTGRTGNYEIRTIKPGSYPGSRNPAHIHAVVKLPGKSPSWIDDFLFADDPYVSDHMRRESQRQGRFANIMALARSDDGTLAGTRDIRIKD